ncbi:aminopeptidase [Paenibacillus gansuensis]|uniref:Aminopeptidase n=1 Tax=Paenibacillus gansuensis TaxID=306542 RepID=A0ABW5PCC0_9BACL
MTVTHQADRFEQQLHKYAELVVKVGVNLQQGQVLYVESPLEAAEFTRAVVRKAYEAGAKYVQVSWNDEAVTRARFEAAPEESFSFYPKWEAETMERLAEEGGALLNIKVPNPDLFEGIDPGKVSKATRTAAAARETFSGYVRTNKLAWCLVKAPTRVWADKVFADLPEEERIGAMWDTIFQMNRIGHDDPVAAWREHIDTLTTLSAKLNAKRYKKLHYKAPGTDLTVELNDGHIWIGGGNTNQSGIYFVPNMPTEEVFTMPRRSGTNGTVSSTMPLNLNGSLVDRFTLTFEEGRVTDFTAEVGYEALKALLETDEGARYLGEVALVQNDSPISNLNRIFYNTGIDENASCHFALGSAYPFNIEGGTQLSKEQLLQRGANVSMTHVDFMIGSADLDIDGEREDGTKEPVFRKGNWAL